jgi:hypothetical protein
MNIFHDEPIHIGYRPKFHQSISSRLKRARALLTGGQAPQLLY